MSGGVDSAVTAALLQDAGHEVIGVTMKLWGGPSDTGCCAVSDVLDARRAADKLGIDHHVFNFGDDFERFVVEPYVEAHAAGLTPNPCIECNRAIKFDRFLERAEVLGFDAVATGHHARLVEHADGYRYIARGADPKKDQSYVLHTLGQDELRRLMFPIGDLTKEAVRAIATERGLRVASKPDSQDVCFITRDGGRNEFLGERIPFTPGTVQNADGDTVGEVDAVELITIGQRKGLGIGGAAEPKYVVDVNVTEAVVTIGTKADLLTDHLDVDSIAWTGPELRGDVEVQTSAHGRPAAARLDGNRLLWHEPHRRVAAGQSVVLYDDDRVVGGGLAV